VVVLPELRGWCDMYGDETMSEEHKFDPQVLVEHIDSFGKKLSEWEVNFIANMMDRPPETITPKQIEIIERIYDEKC